MQCHRRQLTVQQKIRKAGVFLSFQLFLSVSISESDFGILGTEVLGWTLLHLYIKFTVLCFVVEHCDVCMEFVCISLHI